MRLNHVNKARKDAGTCNRCQDKIKRGQPYYWFKFRFGGKRVYCHKHRPRQSEMTQSDKLGRIYAAQESLEDSISNFAGAESFDQLTGECEALADALQQAADEAREVGQEYNDSADNIEQAFPGGSSTIDECREKADNCESWADSLEQAAQEVRDVPGNIDEGEQTNEQELEDAMTRAVDLAQDACNEQQL